MLFLYKKKNTYVGIYVCICTRIYFFFLRKIHKKPGNSVAFMENHHSRGTKHDKDIFFHCVTFFF